MPTAFAASVFIFGCATQGVAELARDCAPLFANSAEPPAQTLARGRELLEQGHAAQAACAFAAVVRAQPAIADHAARWQAEALLAAGRASAARRVAQAHTASAASPHAKRALLRVTARAHHELGAHADAREAWRRAARGEPDAEQRAELLRARARSHEAQGNRDEASARWLELWRKYGATRAGAEAGVALERLHPFIARAPHRNADAQRARCTSLARARRNAAALASCDAALALVPSAVARAKLKRARADLLFRLRRYDDAQRAYAALAPSRETDFWRARSLARSGKVTRAVALFENVARARDRLAFRARFLLATLLEEDEPARAAASYQQVAKGTHSAEQRRAALWRLGWNEFRARAPARASKYFEQLARDDPTTADALRARYWATRARALASGDAARAGREFAALAAAYPFSYHGLRALERAPRVALHAARAARVDFGGDGDDDASATAKMRRRAPLPARTVTRARILTDAGFGEDAAAELAPLRRQVRDDANRTLLATLFHNAGDYHAAGRLVLDAYQKKLRHGPTRVGGGDGVGGARVGGGVDVARVGDGSGARNGDGGDNLARTNINADDGAGDMRAGDAAARDGDGGGAARADVNDGDGGARIGDDIARADVVAADAATTITNNKNAQLWRLAWPLAFADEVEAATAAVGIPRALLYALMREESHYRPRVVSVVGARGLAQIMPETGRVLAAGDASAAPFDPEELFDPARNLALAARYLAQLLARFDGRVAPAVAAYNAGPEAVQRWLTRAPPAEDAWVEAIPYAQTRGYVKRVLRSAQAYRLLYGEASGDGEEARAE